MLMDPALFETADPNRSHAYLGRFLFKFSLCEYGTCTDDFTYLDILDLVLLAIVFGFLYSPISQGVH